MIDQSAIEMARNDPASEHNAWLTFYLMGSPLRHASMEPGLKAVNAVNLGGAEGGFVYAKVPVSMNAAEIEERISYVRKLADDAEVAIELIDLDSSEDIAQTKTYTLWAAP
jgi:hypothetical protein